MTAINGIKFSSPIKKPNTVFLIIILLVFNGCAQKNKKYKQGVKPEITISGTNTERVKKYEKFEVMLDLKNVEIENPYDPADIDVICSFLHLRQEKI